MISKMQHLFSHLLSVTLGTAHAQKNSFTRHAIRCSQRPGLVSTSLMMGECHVHSLMMDEYHVHSTQVGCVPHVHVLSVFTGHSLTPFQGGRTTNCPGETRVYFKCSTGTGHVLLAC